MYSVRYKVGPSTCRHFRPDPFSPHRTWTQGEEEAPVDGRHLMGYVHGWLGPGTINSHATTSAIFSPNVPPGDHSITVSTTPPTVQKRTLPQSRSYVACHGSWHGPLEQAPRQALRIVLWFWCVLDSVTRALHCGLTSGTVGETHT